MKLKSIEGTFTPERKSESHFITSLLFAGLHTLDSPPPPIRRRHKAVLDYESYRHGHNDSEGNENKSCTVIFAAAT